MKVYSFFLIVQNVPKDFIFIEEHSHCLKERYAGFHPVRELEDGRKSILYAITNNSKYAEIFRKTRNPDVLIMFKSDMSKDKYKHMLKDYNLWEEEIIKETLDEGKTGKSIKHINVLLTEYEKDKINDETVVCQLFWQQLFGEKGDGKITQLEVFSNEIRALLTEILYDKLEKLVSDFGANDGDYEYYKYYEYAELNYFKSMLGISEGTKINTFSLFVKLFKCVLI